MKRLLPLLIILAGCTTNGQYDSAKTWTLIGAVALGSMIAADDNANSSGSNCHWVVGSNGSTQVCR